MARTGKRGDRRTNAAPSSRATSRGKLPLGAPFSGSMCPAGATAPATQNPKSCRVGAPPARCAGKTPRQASFSGVICRLARRLGRSSACSTVATSCCDADLPRVRTTAGTARRAALKPCRPAQAWRPSNKRRSFEPRDQPGKTSAWPFVFRIHVSGWRDGSRNAEPEVLPRWGPAGALRRGRLRAPRRFPASSAGWREGSVGAALARRSRPAVAMQICRVCGPRQAPQGGHRSSPVLGKCGDRRTSAAPSSRATSRGKRPLGAPFSGSMCPAGATAPATQNPKSCRVGAPPARCAGENSAPGVVFRRHLPAGAKARSEQRLLDGRDQLLRCRSAACADHGRHRKAGSARALSSCARVATVEQTPLLRAARPAGENFRLALRFPDPYLRLARRLRQRGARDGTPRYCRVGDPAGRAAPGKTPRQASFSGVICRLARRLGRSSACSTVATSRCDADPAMFVP